MEVVPEDSDDDDDDDEGVFLEDEEGAHGSEGVEDEYEQEEEDDLGEEEDLVRRYVSVRPCNSTVCSYIAKAACCRLRFEMGASISVMGE